MFAVSKKSQDNFVSSKHRVKLSAISFIFSSGFTAVSYKYLCNNHTPLRLYIKHGRLHKHLVNRSGVGSPNFPNS